MFKPKSIDNMLLNIENEEVDGAAYVEYRLEEFKNRVDEIDEENLKLIAKRMIEQIPEARRLRKFKGHGKTSTIPGVFTDLLKKVLAAELAATERLPNWKAVLNIIEGDAGKGIVQKCSKAEHIKLKGRKDLVPYSQFRQMLTPIRSNMK